MKDAGGERQAVTMHKAVAHPIANSNKAEISLDVKVAMLAERREPLPAFIEERIVVGNSSEGS